MSERNHDPTDPNSIRDYADALARRYEGGFGNPQEIKELYELANQLESQRQPGPTSSPQLPYAKGSQLSFQISPIYNREIPKQAFKEPKSKRTKKS